MTEAVGIASDLVLRSQFDIDAFAVIPIREPGLYRRTVQLYTAQNHRMSSACCRFQDHLTAAVFAVAETLVAAP